VKNENNWRNRYSRQTFFHGIGEEGQQKLTQSRAVIIGCGALGCNIANLLVRAGVGKVRIVDRDFVEYHNLQRQTLFDEDDVKSRVPKAIAAGKHLKAINSLVEIESIVADVNSNNVEEYCAGSNIILDGMDNLETRYLVNDISLKLGIPYIYGGAISSIGMTMTVIPGLTPCFRCVFPDPPPQRTMPTCETDGILGSTASIISSIEAAEAIKILVGSPLINKDLITLDIWDISFEKYPIVRKDGCPSCSGRYDFLGKKKGLVMTSLCGQSRSVQVVDMESKRLDLQKLAGRLTGVKDVYYNEYMLGFDAGDCSITVFNDGRAIIKNTIDESLAEGLYRKFIRAQED
jgi:molybdopterin-synthase adenylyltransferase